MAQSSVARFVVWLIAALVAWAASTWASGEPFDWHQRVSKILGSLLPPVYRRVGLPEDFTPTAPPDTTAVILNWSRFPNVLQISSLLCSPALDGIIAQVFIWNNSPNPITLEDFASTGCPAARLRIYNSAENLYFQARFLACAQAATPYCFIQDDDYLVYPEVVRALHARVAQAAEPRGVYLLPAHEHLSTTLRTIRAGPVHTSFAWLGHGALLPRADAADFLALLRALAASADEQRMADNYYTLLGNRVPEVWFDQGHELGGGAPFTVGAEGRARNARHIRRAGEYLEAILGRNAGGASARAQPGVPYVSTREAGPDGLETSVDLGEEGRGPRHMLEVEAARRARLSNHTAELYLEHPPSRAVDARAATYFESSEDAAAGDYVLLDYFDDVYAQNWTSLRLVWVVDDATRHTLETCVLSTSADGLTWDAVEHTFGCWETQGTDSGSGGTKTNAWRCHAEWTPDQGRGQDSARGPGMQSVRVLLGESQRAPWRIYEMYLSGRR